MTANRGRDQTAVFLRRITFIWLTAITLAVPISQAERVWSIDQQLYERRGNPPMPYLW